MGAFDKSQGIPGITFRQGIPLSVPLSVQIQQAVSLLLGYTYGEGVVLRASPSGILYVAEPRLSDILHVTASGDDEAWQGQTLLCTQVMCMAHPDNTGRIWVAARRAASDADSIPLDKTNTWTFSVENLNEIHALIETTDDKLIVAYSL